MAAASATGVSFSTCGSGNGEVTISWDPDAGTCWSPVTPVTPATPLAAAITFTG